MTALSDARRAYLDLPSNFGPTDHVTRMVEADAFTAGWEAAVAALRPVADPETMREARLRLFGVDA